MTSKEFKKALEIAKNFKIDLTTVSIDHLIGYGRSNFEAVSTSLNAVAVIMRWQGINVDGSWDEEELDAIRVIGRKKFLITNLN